jgi:hypothetical protein
MKFPLFPAAALLALTCGPVRAVSSVSLDFNGGAGGAGDTGFESVYNEDTTGYTLGGGKLTIETLPGDIFGRYEAVTDPDDAKNVFYSTLDTDPNGTTTVDAKVTYTGLNENYHGGGIWFGTDEDHYLRLGVINNNGIAVEALRENEDLWPGAGGPGNDIEGHGVGIGTSPLGAPLDVYLRLVREGNTAKAYYSLDGLVYNWVDNHTFDAIATSSASGASVEAPGTFKVGAYAFGGGGRHGFAAFDSFSATSGAAIPEPGSIALLMSGGVAFLGTLRKRKTSAA